MTTKTVSNAQELTMAVLEQFSEMFEKTFEPYNYTIQPNGTITVFNDEGMKCLEISDTEVTMRDIIQDAYNDAIAQELVKKRQTEVNELFDILDPLSEFGERVKVTAKPSITYKSFLYFDDEEVWKVAMDTETPDVLPFEGSAWIKKIKELILKDLATKWKMD